MKTLKTLPLLVLGSFSLTSCGLQVTTGPIDRSGAPVPEAEAAPADPAGPAAAAPAPGNRRTTGTVPAPITGNPFDVPDVTGSLPAERDLQPGAAPAAGKPQDPAGDGPTVTAPAGGAE